MDDIYEVIEKIPQRMDELEEVSTQDLERKIRIDTLLLQHNCVARHILT